MAQKSYFESKIGKQTLSGIVTISSFPLLYVGGVTHFKLLIGFGLFLLLVGMISVPAMTFFDKRA